MNGTDRFIIRLLLAALALCAVLALATAWQHAHPLPHPAADEAAPMVYGGL